jgi:hypothetical protein
MVILDELAAALNDAATRRPGYVRLLAAPDVAAALRTYRSPVPPPWQPAGLTPLMRNVVQVVEAADSPPGRFRIVHHAACDADPDTLQVGHDGCTVLLDGTLA